jgi:hypothetical protein
MHFEALPQDLATQILLFYEELRKFHKEKLEREIFKVVKMIIKYFKFRIMVYRLNFPFLL